MAGTDESHLHASRAPTASNRVWNDWALWQVSVAAALVAAAVNVVLYLVARAVGVPLEITEVFDDDYQRMPLYTFAIGTLLDGGVVAAIVAVACRRWAPHPRRWFVTLAVVGTIVSFALPAASDGTTATKVVLAIAHVTAAAILIPAFALVLPTSRVRGGPRDERGRRARDARRDRIAAERSI